MPHNSLFLKKKIFFGALGAPYSDPISAPNPPRCYTYC